MDPFSALSSTVKTAALSLAKVANDLVLLSSGPTGGIGELQLAPRQAGSSMMPGKVNPVHAMGLTQIAYFVAGTDQSVMLAAAGGQLETNNYMPLIAVSLFKAIATLQHAILAFDEHCVQPMTVNREVSERNLLESTAIAPALKAEIGYSRTASLVGNAHASGRPLIEVIVSGGVMRQERVLDLLRESSGHPDLDGD
jgi:aspartate ammonia-lyase